MGKSIIEDQDDLGSTWLVGRLPLKYSRTKRFDEFTFDELKHLSAKAMLPEKRVLDAAIETVALFHEHWQKEKNLPLYSNVIAAIDKYIDKVPIHIS